MLNIIKKIKKLEQVLIEKDAPALKYFNPCKTNEEILNILNLNGINLNPNLISLYEWHNGTNQSDDHMTHQSMIEILPMGIFYSIETMIFRRNEIIDWNYFENAANFLPIFGSREDDMYLLNNSTGEVFYMAPAIQILCELEFRSIEAMVDCIIECYEKAAFRIDTHSGFSYDSNEYYLIKEKFM